MIALFLALGLVFCIAVLLFIVSPAYFNRNISQHKSFVGILIVCVAVIAPVMYYFLGDSRGLYNKALWDQLENAQQDQQTELHIPMQLINSLQIQLQQHPHNSLNWLLLARMYFSGQDYHDAAQAFKQALAIYPNDPEILVEYATSLYMGGENKGEEWNKVIQQVQELSSPTTMSLSLLANIAFAEGDKAQALHYWKMVLNMLPPDSALHQSLQKTITQVETSVD